MENVEIKSLIDKYLDGLTSGEEEQLLRDFFTDPCSDIPEEWRVYKALFGFVVAERGTADNEKPAMARTVPLKNLGKRKARSMRLWLYAASAAASVAIIVTVFLTLPRHNDNYAVIDGKVYTNKKVVKEEALEALQLVSSDGDDSFGALKMMR